MLPPNWERLKATLAQIKGVDEGLSGMNPEFDRAVKAGRALIAELETGQTKLRETRRQAVELSRARTNKRRERTHFLVQLGAEFHRRWPEDDLNAAQDRMDFWKERGE